MLQINFTPFPTMETERLLLRRITNEDVPDIFAFRSDPEVMKYIPRPVAKTQEDVLPVLEMINNGIEKNESINWAMADKETNRLIGMIGYPRMDLAHHRAEVGYVLHPGYHGKGLMQEALKSVIGYGFEGMNLHSISAIIDAENAASEKVLERFGFRKEAHFREDFLHNGKFRDSIYYGLLASEWASRG